MYIHPALLVILFSLLSILCAFLVLVLYLLAKARREKEEAVAEKLILQQAQQLSKTIIQEAKTQTETLLKELEANKNQSLSQVQLLLGQQKKALESISQAWAQAMQQSLKEVISEDINTFRNTSKQFQQTLIQDVEAISKVIEEETVGTEKALSEKTNQEYRKIQEELERYKKESLEKIKQELPTLLTQIAQEVLKKSITPKEHEELIVEALNQAKLEIDNPTPGNIKN